MIQLDIKKILQSQEGEMTLDVSLKIKKGEIICLYGESGAGKTSCLRMLSGLLKPDEGTIVVDENLWFDSSKNINAEPQKRRIGYVFQDYALFPNMTVAQNLNYAVQNKSDKNIIDEIIDILELNELKYRKPDSLSGGQKQRVALGRALVQRPNILLLDEPLAALDNVIRLKLQDYILKVHKEFNLTTILISHDISEIIKLSDKVAIIKKGKIIEQGLPSDLFVNKSVSGKFSITGEILKIELQDVVYVISVLVHNNIVKAVADKSEVENLKVGDKVMLASKAFNPIIYKIEN